MLPQRKQILNGVLSSDLIGFYTHEYARHFKTAVTRLLGYHCREDGVDINGGFAAVSVFPVGILPANFLDTLKTPAVQRYVY